MIFHKNKGAIVQIKWEVYIGKDIKNLSETFAIIRSAAELYWHFVDVIWVILFALLYLL